MGGTADAGVVCGAVGTVWDKYFTDIAGHYGEIEGALRGVCSITP